MRFTNLFNIEFRPSTKTYYSALKHKLTVECLSNRRKTWQPHYESTVRKVKSKTGEKYERRYSKRKGVAARTHRDAAKSLK